MYLRVHLMVIAYHVNKYILFLLQEYICKEFNSISDTNKRMSSRSILKRTSAPSTRKTQIVQSQVTVVRREQPGSKESIKSIMQRGNLEEYGMNTKLTSEEIDAYPADVLYELAYGGTSDYFKSPIFNE